jgi:hypothetical protein
VPHVLPGAAENPLLLEPEEFRVGVPVERERGAARERIAELAARNFGVDEEPMSYKGTMERVTT